MYSTRLRIKELLRERRWTTKILAEKTGLSESYLTHIKNGTRRWNEDALKKLAEAFGTEPLGLFDYAKERTDQVRAAFVLPEGVQEQMGGAQDLKVQVVPVVGRIPTSPTPYNNQAVQHATGFHGEFLPVSYKEENRNMFAYCNPDSSLAPLFAKGDYLVIAPGVWISSGDIVAVQYGQDMATIDIMHITLMDEFVTLEPVNRKRPPVALVKDKDQFKIIGKVVYRYQKLY